MLINFNIFSSKLIHKWASDRILSLFMISSVRKIRKKHIIKKISMAYVFFLNKSWEREKEKSQCIVLIETTYTFLKCIKIIKNILSKLKRKKVETCVAYRKHERKLMQT
jgi:hypothetical protein